jgi:signal transduction histidine kinase/Fe-S-cluster-containing hydrogenase component 2
MQPRVLIETIKERCRVCYTCVRECPAKAIRIVTGQAQVVPERCIGCGNCVHVCSQRAKQVLSSVESVDARLLAARTDSAVKVAAIVAPSFPGEFPTCDYTQVVGMIRALGFTHVCEVAFGADLVADRYRRLLAENTNNRYVATSCPSVVAYVERYSPDLVPNLAPIVSPMIAMARVLKRMHGDDIGIVFLGPCIAKKAEAESGNVAGDVDDVLTFLELRQMLQDRGITAESASPGEFDPPHAGLGALFPISRGLLQAAEIQEDLVSGRVICAEGRTRFVEAVREFEAGDTEASLLEVLCCEGCIMGAGMSDDQPLFRRRASVSRFVRLRAATLDPRVWKAEMDRYAGLDLSRKFEAMDQRWPVPLAADEFGEIMAMMGKFRPEDELNCGACGYDTCREHAIAIFKGLAESEMCLPYTIEQLRKTVRELAVSNDQLASAQVALIQSEKLASMGQLAAGIAHEVNNPLGVVIMFAHLLLEEYPADTKIGNDLRMIVDQADRCKKIVAGLLHFARQNKVTAARVHLPGLIDDVLRAHPLPPNVEVRIDHDKADLVAEVDHDQIVQVLTNLINNAVAAMPNGGRLTLRAAAVDGTVRISVNDTGVGITKENMERLFQPFFTTKPIGMGTGLGLAISYGIVKMHHGDIEATSNADPAVGPTGTTFTVTLPRRRAYDGEPEKGAPRGNRAAD